VIAGDFNVNWTQNCPGHMKRSLLEWSDAAGLSQLVTEVTRRREITLSDGTKQHQESTLDLVFVKEPIKLKILSSIASDHDLVCVTFSDKIIDRQALIQTTKLEVTDWRRYNPQRALSLLSDIPISETDPELILDRLTSNMIQVLNIVAPKRIIRLRGENEFVNSQINALKKKRDRLWKKYKKTNASSKTTILPNQVHQLYQFANRTSSTTSSPVHQFT